MKRIIALILALAVMLLLAACAQEAPVETSAPTTEAAATTEAETVPETTAAPTEPPTEPGTVRADGVGLLLTTHQRGDTVTVLGKWNNYYIVEGETDYLLEARLVRLTGEEAVEAYEAWARPETHVYTDAYFRGEPIATLSRNTKLQVVDAKDNWMLVEYEGGAGYVLAEQVSQWYLKSGGGSSSGGGGSQDGSDVDLGGLSATGGSWYALPLGEYYGTEYEAMDPTGATVLADGTEGYVRVLSREETVKVAEVGEESCMLLIGMELYEAPRWAIALEGDEAYTPWSAYSRYGTVAYGEYQLQSQVAEFTVNQRVEVVDAIESLSLYVVKLETGFGYVPMEGLSDTQIYVGGGGSSSGGSEWTPPAL